MITCLCQVIVFIIVRSVNGMTDKIRKELFSLQDLKYREMQVKIILTVKPERIIGVRTPELRRMAKELGGREGIGTFLNNLPH